MSVAKISALAKKMRKQYPSKKWTDLIKLASKQIKSGKVGDYKINKASFTETRQPVNPRKKKLKKEKKFSVTRTGEGKFKKIKRVAGVSTSEVMKKISGHHSTISKNAQSIAGIKEKIKGATPAEKKQYQSAIKKLRSYSADTKKAISALKKYI